MTGDYDEDGTTDLAVANQASDDVSVLLGTGDGGFRAAAAVPVGDAPSSIAAGDLDRDGKFELVGSFRSVGADYTNYALFMIFEPAGDQLKAALTWYHKGAEADAADRRFVDQLDLDGDGVSEVIAEGHYYESNDYFIYKKQRGQWRSVYQGGGGGC